ncbi:MAG TPA: hypothetical protein VHM02_10865 [Thermoanaerobaculia bacterium]|nr:hypothetical protein [Thermoanaerobaculia bacterium]
MSESLTPRRRAAAKRIAAGLALAAFLALAAWAIVSESIAAVAPGDAAEGDGAWRLDPLWDDGRAEVCAYRVTWPRYGAPRQGSALLVLVKEPWAPELDVKADAPRDDGFEVLKLNHVRDVRTGIYEYHQMASVFLDRRRGSLVKMATTSSEACGITTAELVDGRLATHSYFDGQGSREEDYPGGLPEDGLPALLRELVGGEAPEAVEVFPSLLSPRLPELAPERWRLARREVEAAGEGGRPVAAVELRLERGDDWRRYVFAREAPHPLLAYAAADGTRYELARCERLAYWEANRPGDEEWLPPELR